VKDPTKWQAIDKQQIKGDIIEYGKATMLANSMIEHVLEIAIQVVILVKEGAKLANYSEIPDVLQDFKINLHYRRFLEPLLVSRRIIPRVDRNVNAIFCCSSKHKYCKSMRC